jgi:hypothetical protein
MVYVLTLDQRGSRRRPDRVDAMLPVLNAHAVLRAFERTAGDELQGVVADPAAVCDLVLSLLRDGGWHVGLGIGPVDEPLPESTRAGRGPAFVHARRAVGRAKTEPHRTSVVGADPYGAAQVETVLWLLATLVARRSRQGWEVADMLAQGRTRGDAAAALGITTSAVSQRIVVAGIVEEQRGRELATALLAGADA